VADEQEHRYNDPTLTSKQFLREMMHDPTLSLGVRMDAAIKLLPLELEDGDLLISRDVALTIRITGINGHVRVEQVEHHPAQLSIGIQSGPQICIQKGPL
jgi:hypothetical protein